MKLFFGAFSCGSSLTCRSSCTGLRSLGTVFGTTLLTTAYTGSIQCTTNDVVTYTGKIFNTTAADQHDRVLLQVVAFAWNVGVNLLAIRQTHTRHLAESGVRLRRCGRRYLDTDTTLERTVMKGIAVLDGIDGIGHRRRLRLLGRGAAGTLDELVDRGHRTK